MRTIIYFVKKLSSLLLFLSVGLLCLPVPCRLRVAVFAFLSDCGGPVFVVVCNTLVFSMTVHRGTVRATVLELQSPPRVRRRGVYRRPRIPIYLFNPGYVCAGCVCPRNIFAIASRFYVGSGRRRSTPADSKLTVGSAYRVRSLPCGGLRPLFVLCADRRCKRRRSE